MTITDQMVEAGARAISDAFHEEGFMPGDDPGLWEEFRKAARACLEAAQRFSGDNP